MKRIFPIWIIFFLGITSCEDVDSIVNSISKRNIIECEAIGFGGSPSKMYKKFEKLKRKASNEELFQLMNHDSLAVVGYSAYALMDKEIIQPHEILQRFLSQDENVTTFCGCNGRIESISSLVYHRYWNKRVEYPEFENYELYKINDSRELQIMDSLILYSENPDWILLSRALSNRIYSIEYSSVIEDWAFKKKDHYALMYVYKNLLNENKERLVNALNEYLRNENLYENYRLEVVQALEVIRDES